MQVCVCVCVHVCVYACVRACVHACVRVRGLRARMCAYVRVCASMHSIQSQMHLSYMYTVSGRCVQVGELIHAALPRCDAAAALPAPRGTELWASAGPLLLPVRGHQH